MGETNRTVEFDPAELARIREVCRALGISYVEIDTRRRDVRGATGGVHGRGGAPGRCVRVKRDRLFDVPKRVRRVGNTTALVPWAPGVCPMCGGRSMTMDVDEATLFRHAGHGATRRTTVDYRACRFRVVRQVQEVRPA